MSVIPNKLYRTVSLAACHYCSFSADCVYNEWKIKQYLAESEDIPPQTERDNYCINCEKSKIKNIYMTGASMMYMKLPEDVKSLLSKLCED